MRRADEQITTTAAIAKHVNTSVYAVPVLNAAPGLRVRCRRSRSPTTSPSGRSVSRSTATTLETTSMAYRARRAQDQQQAASRAAGSDGWVDLVVAGQRRSSRCLHVMHSVARGKAISRILPMGLPHNSQTP